MACAPYPLLLLGCCVWILLSPVSCVGTASASASSLADLEPSWRQQALLDADSWLQPSGPGHGHLTAAAADKSLNKWRRGDNLISMMEEEGEGEEPAAVSLEGIRMMGRKRALSALSRWKPFTSAWGLRGPRQHSRAPLVSALLPPEADLVSAETRAALLRPVGQPLRWGKRRRR